MEIQDLTVSFNQAELRQQTLPPKLNAIVKRYNGLCELICNRIIMKDLLGKCNRDLLNKEISIAKLEKCKVVNSHILHVYSFARKLMAFLFRVYPDNLFSYSEQRQLVGKSSINFELLFRKFDSVEDGTTVKLQIFTRKFLVFYGHSTLVKKVNENEYIFFDPNNGEHRQLSKFKLSVMLNECMYQNDANDLFFLKGSTYLDILRKKNILSA